MEELIARSFQQDQGQAQKELLTAPEAERMIETLRIFPLEEVGSIAWLSQHEHIEKLNLQAHHNARAHQDEFVVEALVSFNKINTLIVNLLTIEAWKEKLYPHLRSHLANKLDNLSSYTMMYHEAAVTNLLEVALFRSDAVEAIDEDHLVELVDWCYRQLVYLNTQAHKDKAEPFKKTAKELMAQTNEEELDEKEKGIRFGTAMCSLSILRYVTDNAKVLPMGIINRVVGANDMPLALVALLDQPPWERERETDRVTERFADNNWTAMRGTDRVMMGQYAAQVWLALNNLVVDDKFRTRYEWDGYRKETLMKIKRHFNEVMFDQLPPLKDLQRAIEEISLGAQAQQKTNEPQYRGGIILEVVPEIRPALLNRTPAEWKDLAKTLQKGVLNPKSSDRMDYSRRRVEEMVKTFEYMMEMEPGADPQKSEVAETRDRDTVYFESKRKVGTNYVMQDHFSCLLDRDRAAEPVVVEAEGGSGRVEGRRWRLKDFSDSALPVPHVGRVLMKYAGKECEALLELPAPETKEAAKEAPAVVWLTVGLLAADGVVLQLKLKRNTAKMEKDRNSGVYHVYFPVGGALTVQEGV